VESLTDREDERFAAGRQLFVEGAAAPLTIVESRPDGVGWHLRFAELADRTAAETLRDVYLEAVVAPGERLADGEFYWHEVVGLAVLDTDGTQLGVVTDIYRAGGAEVAVVDGDAGELDVPLVKAIVRSLDPGRGEIVVDGHALGLRAEPDEPEASVPSDEAGTA
jgi:16S rRNA processing protein RimM